MTKSILAHMMVLFMTSILTCCTPRVIHFANDKAPFEKYETYAILNLKNRGLDISQTGNASYGIIENSIGQEMNRRSYVANSDADLIVRYEFISTLVSPSSNNNVNSQFNPMPVVNRVDEEAALLLEMIDVNTKKIIWQASIDLPNLNKKAAQEESLKQAITRLFDTYLYSARKNTADPSLKQGK